MIINLTNKTYVIDGTTTVRPTPGPKIPETPPPNVFPTSSSPTRSQNQTIIPTHERFSNAPYTTPVLRLALTIDPPTSQPCASKPATLSIRREMGDAVAVQCGSFRFLGKASWLYGGLQGCVVLGLNMSEPRPFNPTASSVLFPSSLGFSSPTRFQQERSPLQPQNSFFDMPHTTFIPI